MPAYILTEAPGSGKTVILRQLEIDGAMPLSRRPRRTSSRYSRRSAGQSRGESPASPIECWIFSGRGSSRPRRTQSAKPDAANGVPSCR